jgi:outer membrane autotransporter protein
MSQRFWFSLFLGVAWVLAPVAPAAAQSQPDLVNRTLPVLQGLCASAGSNTELIQGSCDIGFGGGAQQSQNALQVAPREQTAASSTATQTTDTQVAAESERLELARQEAQAGDAPRMGAFLNGSGGWGDVGARGESEGYDVWGGGAQAGFDYRLTEEVIAGVGVGWNRQKTEFDRVGAANGSGISTGGGEIESDAYTPSVYASFFRGGFHADAILTYTYLDYEFERPVVLLDITTPVNATAKGDTDAHQFGASLFGGYEFRFGSFGIGPIAGVDYRQTWIDGYRESGVPGFPLDYDDQDIKSLVTSLGADASYAISTGFGVVVPYVRATLEHEFENDARNIDARLFLNDDPTVGDTLVSRTESPDRDYARFGAGVSAQLAEGISAFVDYDAVFGLREVEQHRFTAGGRIEF